MNEVRMNLLHDKSCTSKEVSERFILFQMKLKQSLKIKLLKKKGIPLRLKGMAQMFSHTPP